MEVKENVSLSGKQSDLPPGDWSDVGLELQYKNPVACTSHRHLCVS